MRTVLFASVALSVVAFACTETPGDLPRCLNPDLPLCADLDAGDDAADATDAQPADAVSELADASQAE